MKGFGVIAATLLATAPCARAEGVRRWEYVVLVRTSSDAKDAFGNAETAAMGAGGVVLEQIVLERAVTHVDRRILVRTRDPRSIDRVVSALRGTKGVLGATAKPLPETETIPGGPDFFASYAAPTDTIPSNAGRIIERHDLPPVTDKRELLEMTDTGAPHPGHSGAERLAAFAGGGLAINFGEIAARLKEGHWRRREDKLRRTPIAILPPE